MSWRWSPFSTMVVHKRLVLAHRSSLERSSASGEDRAMITRPMTLIASAYLVAIGGAELVVTTFSVLLGLLCHAVLVIVLLNHYILLCQARTQDLGNPDASYWYSDVLPVLALAPLLRVLSLTVPLKDLPQLWWYTATGLPLLIAVALTARLLALSPAQLGLQSASWRAQAPIALSGVPLGFAAFLVEHPKSLVPSGDRRDLVIVCAALIVFVGFTEELLFRGLVQRAATELFGRTGLLWTNALFAVMYIGSPSLRHLLLLAIVGCFFSWCVERTGSIWGVALAHGLFATGLILVYPLMWH